MYKKLAVAYDETPEANHAFHTALCLAKQLNSELHVITILEQLPAYTAYTAVLDGSIHRSLTEDRDAVYNRMRAKAEEDAVKAGVLLQTHQLDGTKIESIVRFVCDQKIDLLVVGLRHHSFRVSRLWSTVYTLAQDLNCSILGVH